MQSKVNTLQSKENNKKSKRMRDSSINYAAEAVIYHAVNGNVFTSQGSQDGT